VAVSCATTLAYVTTRAGVGHASWAGRAPLVIAATIPVLVLVALPWRSVQLPAVPGFAALWLALLVACDLLTVVLLMGQYRAGGSPRLLALSWAYLWSAGVAVLYAVAVPGVLQSDPSFAADPDSLQWLWVSRHVVPPALIGLALAPWPASFERHVAARRPTRATMSWCAAAVLTLLFAQVIAKAPEGLPTITVGDRLDDAGIASVAVLNALAVGLAVWGVAKRRSTEGLERWAVVASVAFLAEVCLVALREEPYTVAFYLAQALSLAAAAFVLLAIVRETSRLQAHATETAHRLEERNAQLVEATRLRDHVTAVVSHDMRTPLAGLQGYLEMLRDDDLDRALAQRMLDRSWTLTRRLTLLTEDLLAAATAEHADLSVTPQLLDLNQQLGECASCFPDLDLELDCLPGLTAYADPLRLQQVLVNLVRNAQKHGAEPVLIAAGPDPRCAGGVLIRVSDAGPGVPATFVPRLFDRYTQGPATAPGGSGLGLSVARDLVAAHHGTIRYERADNAFVLTLPPASTAVSPPATGPAASPRPRAATPAGEVRQRARRR